MPNLVHAGKCIFKNDTKHSKHQPRYTCTHSSLTYPLSQHLTNIPFGLSSFLLSFLLLYLFLFLSFTLTRLGASSAFLVRKQIPNCIVYLLCTLHETGFKKC